MLIQIFDLTYSKLVQGENILYSLIKNQGIILLGRNNKYGGVNLNTAKDRLKKLIDEIPETKAGEVLDFLLYIKGKSEQELYLTPEEEEKIWHNINTDEMMNSEEVRKLLIGESDE